MSLATDKLAADLAGTPVEVGVLRGWWAVGRVDGHFLIVTFAAPPSLYAPGKLTLRVDCDGYPDQPPTGMPVDPSTGEMLDDARRPKHGRCAMTFRADWEGGRALYLPLDRVALTGHSDWPTAHAHEQWDPTRGIVQLLLMVRRDLTGGLDASLLHAA